MNTVRFKTSVSADMGKIRTNNEDNFYFNGIHLTKINRDEPITLTGSTDGNVCLYAVCDGMGGEAMGEEASLIVCEILKKYHDAVTDNDDIQRFILKAINEANEKICRLIIEKGEERIGTTIALLCIYNDTAYIYNIGDSRVYLCRNKKLQRISVDDTVSQRLVNMGMITEAEARNHKDRNKLTQHIGIFPNELTIYPHISEPILFQKGDKFIICSDGLTDMVDETQLCSIVSENNSTEKISVALVNEALKNGGRDNVTVIVAESEGDSPELKQIKKMKALKNLAIALCVIFVIAVIVGATAAVVKYIRNNNTDVTNDVSEIVRLYWGSEIHDIEVGKKSTILVGYEPANAEGKIEYSSSDENVISIDKYNGSYEALSEGDAVITASVGELKIEMPVHVYTPIEDIIDIPDTIRLTVGQSIELNPKTVPESESIIFEFESENEDIAYIDENANLVGKNIGETTITIYADTYSENYKVLVVGKKKK